jgi:hypothetical protein
LSHIISDYRVAIDSTNISAMQKKYEIERLVAKMLKDGIVVPSISPFASLVLLFKKRIYHGGFV